MKTRRPTPTNPGSRSQAGGILVEFALVAFAFYLLVAGALALGRMVFYAQTAQDAARVAARELALTPLPADIAFDEALALDTVRARVFDPARLVVDLDDDLGGLTLDEFFATLPVLNQALRPVMIFDRVEVDGAERKLLRYPGALLRSSVTGELFVAIPRVVERGEDGVETIEWLNVVEEVRDAAGVGPFSVDAVTGGGGVPGGLVALRIHIPFQAAALSGFRESPDGPLEPNVRFAITAEDGSVTEIGDAPGVLVAGESALNTYSGTYGLGAHDALGRKVRPFRRLIVAQALFRREAFQ